VPLADRARFGDTRPPETHRTAQQNDAVAAFDLDAGPGGAVIVTDNAGQQWLAYHAWPPDAVGYDAGGVRSLRFAALTWSHGSPVLIRP
jgi:hypothetical protein